VAAVLLAICAIARYKRKQSAAQKNNDQI